MLHFLVVVNGTGRICTDKAVLRYVCADELLGATDAALDTLLAGADGLLLTGGPQHIPRIAEYPELQDELRLLAKAVQRRMFVFGICLGFQLINQYYGNTVHVLETPHIGRGYLALDSVDTVTTADPFVRQFPFARVQNAVSIHYDGVVENTSPELLTVARDCCGHVYMVAHRTLPVYGIQSHPEATAEGLADCAARYGFCLDVPDAVHLAQIRAAFFEALFASGKT
jgi:GMP synthase-like glutamine amidotransferase